MLERELELGRLSHVQCISIILQTMCQSHTPALHYHSSCTNEISRFSTMQERWFATLCLWYCSMIISQMYVSVSKHVESITSMKEVQNYLHISNYEAWCRMFQIVMSQSIVAAKCKVWRVQILSIYANASLIPRPHGLCMRLMPMHTNWNVLPIASMDDWGVGTWVQLWDTVKF